MRFIIQNRDFTDMPIQPDLNFTIEPYSFSTFGGPKLAPIAAKGKKENLFSLLNHLRAPIEIINDLGEVVWWGYIHEVSITWGNLTFGVSVDSMYNRVAIAYTEADIRYTTEWSEHAISSEEYGIKEILGSIAESTAGEALQRRDTILQTCAFPITTVSSGGNQSGTARIICRGWINTLDWIYYQNLAGVEGYEDLGDVGREVGEDDRPILAQSFQIASTEGWEANSVWLNLWKVGDPADTLIVTLRADNAGDPGAVLATAVQNAEDIPEESEWIEFVFDDLVYLNPGTTYWIHAQRSGAVVFEGPDYYMLSFNTDRGYPRGIMKLYNTNTASWVLEDYYSGDLNFRVSGLSETTSQISQIILSAGQFFEGVIIETASGININPYRDGDSTALYELESLLLTGTSDDHRLLCEVTKNRYLRIYREPDEPNNPEESYSLMEDGQILTQYRTHVDQTECPVGVWAHLVEVIPDTIDFSLIRNPNLFLIEEAQYDLASGYQIVRTRNQADIFGAGTVQG